MLFILCLAVVLLLVFLAGYWLEGMAYRAENHSGGLQGNVTRTDGPGRESAPASPAAANPYDYGS